MTVCAFAASLFYYVLPLFSHPGQCQNKEGDGHDTSKRGRGMAQVAGAGAGSIQFSSEYRWVVRPAGSRRCPSCRPSCPAWLRPTLPWAPACSAAHALCCSAGTTTSCSSRTYLGEFQPWSYLERVATAASYLGLREHSEESILVA